MEFKIRKATQNDVSSICRVQADAVRQMWSGHYSQKIVDSWVRQMISPESIDAMMRRKSVETYVAVSDGKIMGFAAVRTGEILLLFVSPLALGQGVGKGLLTRLEKASVRGGRKSLHVKASLNSRPFFEANGFDLLGKGILTVSDKATMPCWEMEKQLA